MYSPSGHPRLDTQLFTSPDINWWTIVRIHLCWQTPHFPVWFWISRVWEPEGRKWHFTNFTGEKCHLRPSGSHTCIEIDMLCIFFLVSSNDDWWLKIKGWHGTCICTEPSRYGPFGSVHDAWQWIQAIHPQSRRGNATLFDNRQQKNSKCHELRTCLENKAPRQWPCADSERVSHIDWQRSIL